MFAKVQEHVTVDILVAFVGSSTSRAPVVTDQWLRIYLGCKVYAPPWLRKKTEKNLCKLVETDFVCGFPVFLGLSFVPGFM